jgi:serine/threonine-protein kinase HipA
MSERKVFVYIDLDSEPHLLGELWTRVRARKESASFRYAETWLKHPENFALDPALGGLLPGIGVYHTELGQKVFGAISDSAPDRWGRILMQRAKGKRARSKGERAQAFFEMDYLLAVNDEARQGALRFSNEIGGPFLEQAGAAPIPPLVNLSKLLLATERVLDDEESEEDLSLLLAPGSSLGGARPKASVVDHNGQLAIAKFPRKDDDYSTVKWEGVALTLASDAGIMVPDWRLETILEKSVIIIRRFDRSHNKRIPFLSAMSMIGAMDNEEHSYLEIVDALGQHGAFPEKDRANLWRRIVFSILISNTDDHLRNHGFLYVPGKGWELSPIYDVNPTPEEVHPRILKTKIDYDEGSASLDLALSVALEFGLSQVEAKRIAKEVGRAVSQWRDVARNLGITTAEIERMSSAFEHYDLQQATTSF